MLKKAVSLMGLLLYISVIFGQNDNAVLWRIETPDGSKSSYLFGTVHLAQRDVMLVPDSVLYAIHTTNRFYGELNYKKLFDEPGKEDMEFMMQKLSHLDSITRGPDWARMVNRINKQFGTTFSSDSSGITQVMTYMQNKTMASFAPEKGLKPLDLMLADVAENLSKPIGGIETMRLQVGMMYDVVDARLADTTFNLDDEMMLNNSFRSVYLNERMDSLNMALNSISASYRDIIFTYRNRTMADSIEKIANTETAFFAIGCGHLVGDSGVIQHLKRRGFVLTPVHTRNRVSLLLIRDLFDKYKMQLQPADAPKEMAPAEERITEITEDQVISTKPIRTPKRTTTRKTIKKKKQ
jgi:uncharacterized protein